MADAMAWYDSVIQSLRDHDIWLVPYVPDAAGWNVVSRLEQDPAFLTVPSAREEEAVGIAAGAYAASLRSQLSVSIRLSTWLPTALPIKA